MGSLDLDYADPPVPGDMADRARTLGRRNRRRRRIATAAGAVVLVAGVTAGVGSGIGGLDHDQGSVSPAAPASTELPISRGKGPSQGHFATAPLAYGKAWYQQIPGTRAITVDPSTGGIIWLSRDGSLRLGGRENGRLTWSTGAPLRDLPAEGLTHVSRFSEAELPPNSTEPIRSVVYGIVRGPVTRVDVELPHGTRRAELADLGWRGLGTLFWTVTDDFTMAGTISGSGDPGPAAGPDPTTVVAYRGDVPAWRWSAADPRTYDPGTPS